MLEILPPDRKEIKTKLVLRIKRDTDGSYKKHKARLVIQGFLERIGLDYHNDWATYAPMASLDSARSRKIDLDSQVAYDSLPYHVHVHTTYPTT